MRGTSFRVNPIGLLLGFAIACSNASQNAVPNPSSPIENGKESAPDAATQDTDIADAQGITNRADGLSPLGDASASDGDSAVVPDYNRDGPAQTTFASTVVTGAPSGPFTVDLYVPNGAGPFPVVILSSGGLQSGAAYSPYARRLASWGILTITRDDPGILANAYNLAADIAYEVVTWLPSQNATSDAPLFGRVDAARIGLAGHSRGVRLSLVAAQTGALGKVKALFGLDPVDDRAPFGRTNIATMGIPVAFMGQTTDSGPNGCAPSGSNYEVLYSMSASPAVAMTVVGADHTMFQDQARCTLCVFCKKGTANPSSVLALSIRYLVAFFARELTGDTRVGPSFQGVGAGADVQAGTISLVSK